MKSGVVVMTLTATVYLRKERRTYSCRIGFSESITSVCFQNLAQKLNAFMPNRLKSSTMMFLKSRVNTV